MGQATQYAEGLALGREVSIEEAGLILGIKPDSVRTKIKRRQLETVKRGSRRMVILPEALGVATTEVVAVDGEVERLPIPLQFREMAAILIEQNRSQQVHLEEKVARIATLEEQLAQTRKELATIRSELRATQVRLARLVVEQNRLTPT